MSNLFYSSKPSEDLLCNVENILNIKFDRNINYGYDYHNFYLEEYFTLDKELLIEFEGDISEDEYKEYIRDFIEGSDAKIKDCSESEKQKYINRYARERAILNKNEQHCMAAIQVWKHKQ